MNNLERRLRKLEATTVSLMSMVANLLDHAGLAMPVEDGTRVPLPEKPAEDAKKAPAAPVPQFTYPQSTLTYVADSSGRAERLDGPPGAPPVMIPEPSREPSIRRVGRVLLV